MIRRTSYQQSTKKQEQKPYKDFEVINSDDCRDSNEITIINKSCLPQAENNITIKTDIGTNCIAIKDLYRQVGLYCDKVFFSSITNQDFIQFVNQGLASFWSLKPEGWNFALSDNYEIPLTQDKCVYNLPSDFDGLSYVSASNKVSECMPARQVFEIKDFVVWDTVQQNRYAATYKYDNISGRAKLYVRMPCFSYCDQDECQSTKKMGGSLWIKYYSTPPKVEDLDSKICMLPKRWGADMVLAQLIAQGIHAYKGRSYTMDALFTQLLTKLKKIDAGKITNNPVDRKQSTSFTIIR